MHQISHLPPLHLVQSFKTLFLNRNFLPTCDPAHDQTWTSSIDVEHPFTVEVVVIGDQLNYLEVALLHVTTIIQNFTLVNLTSITTPHRVWLPFGASVLFLDLRT